MSLIKKLNYMNNIEESIRTIVVEELAKLGAGNKMVPVAEFCRKHGISRVTIWRAEKEGRLKVTRIGKKVFVNPNQFV
jgi:hypothetical protein